MTPTERTIVREAVVNIDAIELNAVRELNRLLKYVMRDDIVQSKERVSNGITTVIGYLNEIPEKKQPVMDLLKSED